jgi:RHS repeat-associated protein
MELEYDPEGQLLNAAIAPPGQPAAKAYTYGYDAAGNRTSEQVDVAGSGAVSTATMSAYNEVNQLTNRTGAGALPVRFTGTVNEPAGVTVNGQTAATTPGAGNSQIFKGYANLSTGSQTVPVMASDYNGNVTTSNYSLTVSGGVGKAFAYDQNGNCTNVSMTGTNTSYEWDAEDRLVAVNAYSTNSATLFRSEFTYDGFDRRVQIVEKTNGVTASTKRFVWDGARLGEERSTNNAVTKRFFGEGEQINGTNYFFTFDHLGSVRELVDGSGVTRGRWNYDPYGRRSANQITSSPVEADFGFTGYYVHQASGLQLALYRAYDADRGTFINRDPIEEDGGLNLYDYVANNPINEIDPLGLWGFYRWLYTGNGNASDEVYDAATEAAGDYVYDSGGVRGGYLGVGYNGKGQGQYAPAGQVGLTGTWTVDDGASLSIDAGVGLQQRGRNSLGQFTSQTFGLGGGDEIWNENNDPCKKGAKFSGIYGGTANKNGGVNFGISGSDSVALGINYGPVYGGIIIDPSRVAGNFRDSFNLLFGH